MKAFIFVSLVFASFLLCFEGYQISAANTCKWGNFQCRNGNCVKYTFRCDGGVDCTDNSDETGCGDRCPSNYFRCSNKKCISREHLCEGDNDCGDNSDETQYLCGSGSPPLTCYFCNTTDSAGCSNAQECSRSLGYTRCARLAYNNGSNNVTESTCATKSECTPEGVTNECKKRGETCKMQCCAKNRCNQPTMLLDNSIWSPKLTCFKCSIHNWENCNTKVTCSGNEGYDRCFRMSYFRIESGKELRVMRTGCASHSNCTGNATLCVGHGSNCKLQCCDNSSCNAPKTDETTSNSNLKCYSCSSTKSQRDCAEQRVLKTCNDNEDRCYQAQVITDYKNDDGVSRMYYKGCALSSKCNSTNLEVCRKHVKSTSCVVKCCSGNACNEGSSFVVSGFLFMTCVIVYLYVGLPV